MMRSYGNVITSMIFFGLNFKRRDSLTSTLMNLGLPSFDTVLAKANASFVQLWSSCNNHIVTGVQQKKLFTCVFISVVFLLLLSARKYIVSYRIVSYQTVAVSGPRVNLMTLPTSTSSLIVVASGVPVSSVSLLPVTVIHEKTRIRKSRTAQAADLTSMPYKNPHLLTESDQRHANL